MKCAWCTADAVGQQTVGHRKILGHWQRIVEWLCDTCGIEAELERQESRRDW